MLELPLTSSFETDCANFSALQPPTTTAKMSDDSSELSSDLSSVPSDDELDLRLTKKDGILKFFSTAPKPTAVTKKAEEPQEASPPRQKREPSPPHEYVLADNTDIAFIVMFRSRFTEAFAKSLPNFGPQELERDIVNTVPGEQAEQFLCAVLGLLLNRKQDVKAGHYNRALEEAVQTHKSQWAKDWESKNPLSGGATFTSMGPTQRLTLLRTLILWSLASSDVVKGIITASYKQNRHEDDLNQPLSVQPWGSDGDRRRYYLIEGLDDTNFRVYRESNHTGVKRTWWSVAGDIGELKALAGKLLNEDGGQKARMLSGKMLAAVPRFEATEEKRKRREYRQNRKQQFKRPEPGFSLYEGRTRGKRRKYTYSDEDDDDDDIYSDSTTNRRSTRNTGTHTPAESMAPTITLSGRQVKSRQGGAYGETVLSGTQGPSAGDHYIASTSNDAEGGETGGRLRRAATNQGVNGGALKKGGRHIEGYNNVDEMTSDEEDDASEQDYGDDEEDDDQVSLQSDGDDVDDSSDGDEDMDDEGKKSLVVKLPLKTPSPDRKTTIKLSLTPRKDSSNTAGWSASTKVDSTQAGTAPTVAQTNATINAKENAKPSSFYPTKEPSAPVLSEAGSQAMNIPHESPSHQNTLSPSLAFRGSPEKPLAFPPSINVGFGGS